VVAGVLDEADPAAWVVPASVEVVDAVHAASESVSAAASATAVLIIFVFGFIVLSPSRLAGNVVMPQQ
jgi:hypothetical protein